MSHSYTVKGYVDIRVNIDRHYQSTSSATSKDIAEIVKDSISNIFCPYEVVGLNLIIQR